jgi:hypothetical protein
LVEGCAVAAGLSATPCCGACGGAGWKFCDGWTAGGLSCSAGSTLGERPILNMTYLRRQRARASSRPDAARVSLRAGRADAAVAPPKKLRGPVQWRRAFVKQKTRSVQVKGKRPWERSAPIINFRGAGGDCELITIPLRRELFARGRAGRKPEGRRTATAEARRAARFEVRCGRLRSRFQKR